jgi:ComF family protein
MLEIASKMRTLCFPPRCVNCRTEIGQSKIRQNQYRGKHATSLNQHERLTSLLESHWCDRCFPNLVHQDLATCWTCGAQLNQQSPLGTRCALCFKKNFRFTRAISLGNYQGQLQQLVIRMKNQHDEPLTIQLGNLLANQLIASELFDNIDLITAVPTHWWRRLKRGFQAAEMIAETIAHEVDRQFRPEILKCQRSTKKQGTLASTARQKNVQNAFSVNRSTSLQGANVLLIDDVMTSGATVNEISRILLRSGVEKVYVGVIARGARVS